MEDMALEQAKLEAEAGQREEKLQHTVDLLQAECFQLKTELQSLKGVGVWRMSCSRCQIRLRGSAFEQQRILV